VHFSPGVELNIGTRLHIEIEPGFDKQRQIDQYIDSFDDESAVEMLGGRHIVAQMERKTVSAEFRIDYTFTPKLSFQAYFQPYMTVGSYSRFKEFTKPDSYEFVEYGKDNNMEIALVVEKMMMVVIIYIQMAVMVIHFISKILTLTIKHL